MSLAEGPTTRQGVIEKYLSPSALQDYKEQFPTLPDEAILSVLEKFRGDIEEAKIFQYYPSLVDRALREIKAQF